MEQKRNLNWVMVGDVESRINNKRILITEIKGTTSPFICVEGGLESNYLHGSVIGTTTWKYMREVPAKDIYSKDIHNKEPWGWDKYWPGMVLVLRNDINSRFLVTMSKPGIIALCSDYHDDLDKIAKEFVLLNIDGTTSDLYK